MEIIFKTREFFSYSLELQRKLARETKNEDLISEILKSESEKVLLSLSENNSLTEEHIRKLSKVDNNLIQRNVASKINAGKDTLEELSKSKYKATVQAVAGNPSTSKKTLYNIIARNCTPSQTSVRIMYCIRRNPSASKEIVEKAEMIIRNYYIRLDIKRKRGY